ncbi:Putative sensory transduction regulator [Micromonospora pattaloongensis]|uniref:Sensory transduction regulator n=1 Tax=Micromonospora pattaloongensis TaxID=405436 RepID=A0A1H3KGR6_9ACTN|nr:YbjN domain-containing protein [Micromonospora pattaloongensis]SDY51371.1 Putative sensory transduction regulator [Micromonospora pattaloongensis]
MPPSGIGDTSGPAPGDAPAVLQPLSNELIAAALRRRDHHFATDDDGDLYGQWEGNLIYFFRLGENRDLFQVRTMAATRFEIDDVPRLYAFCNAWNHDRLWPKAFVHVEDDGTARVCGEVAADLERGVTLGQLDQLIGCGIVTGCQLAAAAAELRP